MATLTLVHCFENGSRGLGDWGIFAQSPNPPIPAQLGFRDKRTISRTNGQIYTAWGLNETATDEKVARTRAAIIVRTGRLIHWDTGGAPHILNERGDWTPWQP